MWALLEAGRPQTRAGNKGCEWIVFTFSRAGEQEGQTTGLSDKGTKSHVSAGA